MDNSEELPPAYPFAAADMDIDMIDKLHASPNGAAIPGASAAGNPVDMARQLAVIVENMMRQINDHQGYARQLEHKMSTIEENARAYESLKQTLREVAGSGITDEDIQTLQRVMQALAQDPNHIMVLASVAQQAPKLQSIIKSFAKLYAAVKQAPPR
jgi:cysteinyl-tRNA synthetase